MLREALALESGIEVIGEAGTGQEAIAQALDVRPDVVLMDVRMPDLDGVQAARAIMQDNPFIKIVALTWSDDPATVRDMLAAGAIGYVVKGGTIEELYTAIRRAAGGEPELDQKVLPAAMEDLRRLLEEERERREQVERLARSRAEFVQVLSHELRTPLTVILGALKMLQRSVTGTDETQLLESALRRSEQLAFLTEGLELVGSEPDDTLAYPRRAIESAVERLGTEIGSVDAPEQTWPGVSHRYVERVAYELISNAVRHGAAPVTVAAERVGSDVVLRVTDAGGWSPPEDGFGPFYQDDMSNTRRRGGFGLGLFVASRLCQASEGELSIRAVDGLTVAEARFRSR
jgi:DNA-binding NarL/FixJ family response regulator/anti-sigma regulatory factor (Ser/Thr protein kinase)